MENILLNQKGTEPLGSGYGLILDTLISSTTWTILQVILFYTPDLTQYKMSRNTELDFRNRMVSLIHGISSSLLSAYIMITTAYVCG